MGACGREESRTMQDTGANRLFAFINHAGGTLSVYRGGLDLSGGLNAAPGAGTFQTF